MNLSRGVTFLWGHLSLAATCLGSLVAKHSANEPVWRGHLHINLYHELPVLTANFCVSFWVTAGCVLIQNKVVWRSWLTLKEPNKNCCRRHFNFLLLSFEENKAWCFKWILCLAEDSHETSSLIFSEKQWKNIYECRLLQSWLAL